MEDGHTLHPRESAIPSHGASVRVGTPGLRDSGYARGPRMRRNPTFVHLYPFAPWAVDGGTMRLQTAIAATERLGTSRAMFWHPSEHVWTAVTRSEIGVDPLETPKPPSTRGFSFVLGPIARTYLNQLKRAAFPSTLWESGRHACRGFKGDLVAPGEIAVLHTSYLSPLARILSARGTSVVVDVYDLIWRVHEVDADLGSGVKRALRRVYATSVRRREEKALAYADALPTAGWTDLRHLPNTVAGAGWCPTGVVGAQTTPEPSKRLRVGIIGHFGHSATMDAAAALLASPLGQDPRAQIVFAGIESEEWGAGKNARSLGRVSSIADFYGEIDIVVVPVLNGSGMKCKLAEAVLSGKAAVTTPAGAEGFPPELSRFLMTTALHDLDFERVRSAQDARGENGTQAFARTLGPKSASRTYAKLLEDTVLHGARQRG